MSEGQRPGQLPDDAGGAATDELGRVGVLLVGHHRAAGRERVGDPDEPEPRVRPPGDLLGQPAEVDHPERHRGHRLDREVAVRDSVERVRADAVEPELVGRRLAIERVARARQRPGPERRDVEPRPRVTQPAAVALGHLDVCQQVMGEEHRLGWLDVGRTGQHRAAVAFGESDERPFEGDERRIERVDRSPRPEPQIRGDLVVARPSGVEPPGQRPDLGRERRLEVHVDVLEGRVPGEDAGRDVVGQRHEAADQRGDFLVGQDPRAAEPVDVRDRACDVVGGERGVDLDRARERGYALVRVATEPTAPGPHRASVRAGAFMLPAPRPRRPATRQPATVRRRPPRSGPAASPRATRSRP